MALTWFNGDFYALNADFIQANVKGKNIPESVPEEDKKSLENESLPEENDYYEGTDIS